MRIIFIALLIAILNAELLEVKADKFESNEISGKSTLFGSVEIRRSGDFLQAAKVVIQSKDKKLQSFIATGGVNFIITTKDGKQLSGSSESLEYDAQSDFYKLLKNVIINEKNSPNSIKGDEVTLNKKTGETIVTGSSSTPAHLIFKLDN